jgi:hypothetical protein
MHRKRTGGFVEDTEGYWNARLSTEGKNQHGIKRSFREYEERASSQIMSQIGGVMAETYASSESSLSVTQYSDDIPLYVTRPSSVCTGSTAGIDA